MLYSCELGTLELDVVGQLEWNDSEFDLLGRDKPTGQQSNLTKMGQNFGLELGLLHCCWSVEWRPNISIVVFFDRKSSERQNLTLVEPYLPSCHFFLAKLTLALLACCPHDVFLAFFSCKQKRPADSIRWSFSV